MPLRSLWRHCNENRGTDQFGFKSIRADIYQELHLIALNNAIRASIHSHNTSYRQISLNIVLRPQAMGWWRHQMETFPPLPAICAGNSLASGEFPVQRPVTRSFDVFFDLCLNKWLRKQSWGWWFETLSRPLWRHCNGIRVIRSLQNLTRVSATFGISFINSEICRMNERLYWIHIQKY